MKNSLWTLIADLSWQQKEYVNLNMHLWRLHKSEEQKVKGKKKKQAFREMWFLIKCSNI